MGPSLKIVNIPRNFDDTSNSDTFCPVLPAGRAAAPRTSARRHLRGGGRPLPRHEGTEPDSRLLTAHPAFIHLAGGAPVRSACGSILSTGKQGEKNSLQCKLSHCIVII